jgi:hypothetical protein
MRAGLRSWRSVREPSTRSAGPRPPGTFQISYRNHLKHGQHGRAGSGNKGHPALRRYHRRLSPGDDLPGRAVRAAQWISHRPVRVAAVTPSVPQAPARTRVVRRGPNLSFLSHSHATPRARAHPSQGLSPPSRNPLPYHLLGQAPLTSPAILVDHPPRARHPPLEQRARQRGGTTPSLNVTYLSRSSALRNAAHPPHAGSNTPTGEPTTRYCAAIRRELRGQPISGRGAERPARRHGRDESDAAQASHSRLRHLIQQLYNPQRLPSSGHSV